MAASIKAPYSFKSAKRYIILDQRADGADSSEIHVMKQLLTNSLERIKKKLGPVTPTNGGNHPANPLPASPLFTPITLTSGYYYSQARRLWQLLLLSVPLDLTFVWIHGQTALPLNPPLASLARGILVMVVVLCSLALVRQRVIELLLALDKLQSRFSKLSQTQVLVILGVFGAVIFAEAALRFGEVSIVALLAALLVAMVAVREIRKTIAEHRRTRQEFSRNRSLWVERANYIIFVFNIVPMMAARVLSFCGGVLLLSGEISLLAFLCFLVSSEGLLLYLEPLKSHFQTLCRRCAQRTSLALLGDGLCPSCLQKTERKGIS